MLARSDIQWGDVPTWAQAVTTTAALIAAGIAVWLELRAAEERRAEARRAQAAQVAFWPTDSAQELIVRNDSPLPIFAARLVYIDNELPGREDTTQFWERDVLAPDHQVLVGVYSPTDRAELERLRLRFIDSNRYQWERDGLGGLRRISAPVRDYSNRAHKALD